MTEGEEKRIEVKCDMDVVNTAIINYYAPLGESLESLMELRPDAVEAPLVIAMVLEAWSAAVMHIVMDDLCVDGPLAMARERAQMKDDWVAYLTKVRAKNREAADGEG